MQLGWAGFLGPLIERFVSPLVAGLDVAGYGVGIGHAESIQFRHAHTVQRVFDSDEARAASPLPGSNRGSRHTDASRVTLNINLGGVWDDGQGGGLKFFVADGAGGEDGGVVTVRQRKGWASIHAGPVPHQAELLGNGYRLNLVVWCD
jgi:hypothetical protein